MLCRPGSHSPPACIVRRAASAALRALRRRSDCSLCSAPGPAPAPAPAPRCRWRRSLVAAAAAAPAPSSSPSAATICLSSRLLTTILTRTAPPTSSRDRRRPPWRSCSRASAAAFDCWCRPSAAADASLGKKHLDAMARWSLGAAAGGLAGPPRGAPGRRRRPLQVRSRAQRLKRRQSECVGCRSSNVTRPVPTCLYTSNSIAAGDASPRLLVSAATTVS
jgi:hypothetical protein